MFYFKSAPFSGISTEQPVAWTGLSDSQEAISQVSGVRGGDQLSDYEIRTGGRNNMSQVSHFILCHENVSRICLKDRWISCKN